MTELKRKKRQGEKIDEQLLRQLMCDSDKTTNEWYLRESLTQEAAEASLLIEQHTKPSQAESRPNLPDPSQKQLEERKKSVPQGTVSPKDNSATSAKSGSSEKTCLSVAQRQQVDKIFADDLRSGIQPRKKRVVALMKSDLVLRGLVNSEIHVKQVIDRVRYLFESRSTVDLYELPEEPVENRTAQCVANIPEKPPSTIESGRVEWSSEETESIQEALTFWTKAPNQQQIRDMFQNSSVLRDIF